MYELPRLHYAVTAPQNELRNRMRRKKKMSKKYLPREKLVYRSTGELFDLRSDFKTENLLWKR